MIYFHKITIIVDFIDFFIFSTSDKTLTQLNLTLTQFKFQNCVRENRKY